MRKTTCAFTGHRPKSYPWNYNEADCDCIFLKEALVEQINQLTERGVTDWLTGMALGADVWTSKRKNLLCTSTVSSSVKGRSVSGQCQSRNGIILFCGKPMR